MSETVLTGLTEAEVLKSRQRHGRNSLYIRPKRHIGRLLLEVVREPMFLLLAVACAIYFILGEQTEGWLMVASIALVVSIEIIQEWRSEKALAALRQFTQAQVRVLRTGIEKKIPAEDVVVGDLLVFSEGERIGADGELLRQSDFSVDEAVLTGESLPVEKSLQAGQNRLFQGTVVASGQGIARVTAVGLHTEMGKLGKSIESIESSPTPLQRQIESFVRQMGVAGFLAFVVVFLVNYLILKEFLPSLLFSLTLAMAIIPEEIPVAFSTFMALGAYRMARHHILVKQPKTVESLGSATVICLDKTGTITENRMTVAEVVDFSGNGCVLEYAMWASEPEPFDAMEKAIHQAYETQSTADRRPAYKMVHEYPLGGMPPMMTHVHGPRNSDEALIIAGKGAVERIARICQLDAAAEADLLVKTRLLAAKGYRVLGVASVHAHDGDFPAQQDDFNWQLEGLIAFYDPPKKNIRGVFQRFYKAGIQVKMITGDYPETALHIAEASGLQHQGQLLTGQQVDDMKDDELQEAVKNTSIFARTYPAVKLRIVEALKANGETVAMTGDGVNDGPALKSAQIGVAMGRRGTEIAKGAASLILLNDNLAHMITAVKMGRRIYNNLRKAIRYVISIHLPIVLTVVLPLVLGWKYIHILAPVHIIFLELVMDPTCAVAYENEPAEPNAMRQPPRPYAFNLFSWGELSFSLFQGFMITLGVLGMYWYAVMQGHDEPTTRSFVFMTLLTSNILLTLANRSFHYTVARTLFYKNNLIWWIIGAATLLSLAILYLPALNELFLLSPLGPGDAGICLLTALVSVGWFEVYKGLLKRV